MSKESKIKQIIELNTRTISSLIIEIKETGKIYSNYDGPDLDDTISALEYINQKLDLKIQDGSLRTASWSSLQNTISYLQNIQNIYLSFKHTNDQNSFQNLAQNVDSALQQIFINLPNEKISSEHRFHINEQMIENSRLKIERVEKSSINLESVVKSLEESASIPINRLNEIYEKTIISLNEKETKTNEILDAISSKSITGSYKSSAAKEKKSAEATRAASVLLMLLSVTIFIHSYFHPEIDSEWKSTLIRLGIALLISVPAAYLAKESSKHREQYYIYLQTALDLAAIHPYLESLPESQQHIIKTEIANKIFGNRSSQSYALDSPTLNAQDIIIELVKNIPNKGK